MENDIVYFELNNWFSDRDYPDEEPFTSWLDDDLNQQFRDEDWVKKNKICVAVSFVDMSQNYCITALKSWVEENCPNLLTKHTKFLRYSEDDEPPKGRFGCPFLEHSEENFGVHWFEEDNNYDSDTYTWVECD